MVAIASQRDPMYEFPSPTAMRALIFCLPIPQVLGNIWVMSRDERLYPDPEIFRPERFLGPPPTEDRAFNPWNYTFGTGKRYQSILPPEVARGVLTTP